MSPFSFSGLVHAGRITHSWRGHTYHIALAGVDSICQTLDSNPLDWHLGNAPLAVVIPIVDLLGEPEVCHTHGHVLIQPAQIGESSKVRTWLISIRKPVGSQMRLHLLPDPIVLLRVGI